MLHDNALTQYIQEELHNDIASAIGSAIPLELGIHCAAGEKNMKDIPSHTDIKNVILYHHENADGSGPFGKKWTEVPVFARIIHLCDLLDQVCCSDSFDSDTWQKVEAFLQEITGSIADEECIEAFRHAFSE